MQGGHFVVTLDRLIAPCLGLVEKMHAHGQSGGNGSIKAEYAHILEALPVPFVCDVFIYYVCLSSLPLHY